MDEASVIYGLDCQGRSLATQQGDTDLIRFFLGTQSLREENKIYLLEFDEEKSLIRNLSFKHSEGEIWNLETSQSDNQLLSTCYQKVVDKNHRVASIWRAPVPEDSLEGLTIENNQEMEELLHIENVEQDIKSILWHPLGNEQVISIEEEQLRVWDLQTSQSSLTLNLTKGQRQFFNGRWNPHHNASQIATSNGSSIVGWDLRSSKQSFLIEGAHFQTVKTLDFNPNKQYNIVSGGDDGYIKFWDLRSPEMPLKTLTHHTHWVWSVRYNHFHDQLLLSSSSDSQVFLSNVVSLSSDPFGHVGATDSEEDEEQFSKPAEPQVDGVIRKYEEHEDSVYAVEWSAADPWVFASLSYDGRLVINHVPKEEKYKILL